MFLRIEIPSTPDTPKQTLIVKISGSLQFDKDHIWFIDGGINLMWQGKLVSCVNASLCKIDWKDCFTLIFTTIEETTKKETAFIDIVSEVKKDETIRTGFGFYCVDIKSVEAAELIPMPNLQG